jgi:hypothetical protein
VAVGAQVQTVAEWQILLLGMVVQDCLRLLLAHLLLGLVVVGEELTAVRPWDRVELVAVVEDATNPSMELMVRLILVVAVGVELLSLLGTLSERLVEVVWSSSPSLKITKT